MAQATEAETHALTSLRTLELMVADLLAVAAEWPSLSVGERESWSLDWGNEIAGLERLAAWAAEDALDAAARARYQQVRYRLRDLLPQIDALELRRPPVALDS